MSEAICVTVDAVLRQVVPGFLGLTGGTADPCLETPPAALAVRGRRHGHFGNARLRNYLNERKVAPYKVAKPKTVSSSESAEKPGEHVALVARI